MPLWVIISLFAAAVQTVRFLLQRRLKGLGLSTGGATFSRFVFAAPLAWGVVAVLFAAGHEVRMPTALFWVFAFFGGLGQIVGTYCTVALFSLRNFAVGIAFTKTETVQVALFSAILLGEAVSLPGWLAILVGVAGVVLLSWPKGTPWRVAIRPNPSMGLGVMAGAAFALAAIGYRGAAQSLGEAEFFTRAAFTLACVTTLQSATMVVGLLIWQQGEVARVLRLWRATFWVGVTGMLGSLGWFTAFTLQNAAYVRTLGQVELVFSLIIGWIALGERVTGREMAGIVLLACSLILIILTV
jgi:drug/metabolite transporter (DMT)-like permease